MTQTIWRIDRADYAAAAPTGEGARLAGGRWTSPGFPAIYCAEHLSLAILEVLAHATRSSQRAEPRVRVRIRLAQHLIEDVADEHIPHSFSPGTAYAFTRTIGDGWLNRAERPALSVPSAIVRTERNYILNPRHPHFDRIVWGTPERIILDDRLWMVGA